MGSFGLKLYPVEFGYGFEVIVHHGRDAMMEELEVGTHGLQSGNRDKILVHCSLSFLQSGS